MSWMSSHRVARLLAPPLLALMILGNAARTDDMEARTLAIHNVERAKLGVADLKWDAALARDAAVWARHLATVGYLVHSENDVNDADPEGENLWAGTAGYYSVDAMSDLWAKEARHYKRGIFPNSSTTGDLEDVGHYTQMVWRSTTKVGCALARGAKDEFFVCRYGEGGNVIGERPY